MAVSHFLPDATLMHDGSVLIVGGSAGAAASEVFHPTNNEWATAVPMVVGRERHTATLLSDGAVLAAGGRVLGSNLSSAELYTPASNSWMSVTKMSGERYDHTATLLQDGTILVVGGAAGAGPALSSAERFH